MGIVIHVGAFGCASSEPGGSGRSGLCAIHAQLCYGLLQRRIVERLADAAVGVFEHSLALPVPHRDVLDLGVLSLGVALVARDVALGSEELALAADPGRSGAAD